MVGWMVEFMDGWVNVKLGGLWLDGRMAGFWMDRWKDEWMVVRRLGGWLYD
jgi:hypothetical protein